MNSIGSDVGGSQQFGRLGAVAGEQGDLLHVGALSVRVRRNSNLHVLDHALAKGNDLAAPLRDEMREKAQSIEPQEEPSDETHERHQRKSVNYFNQTSHSCSRDLCRLKYCGKV